jgi:hypothetical protein
MRTDWVPSADVDLDLFCQNFSTKITATPASYGLIAGDATSFATLKTDFTTKLAAATNPSTRTKVTVASKDTSRAALNAALRSLAKRVQAYTSITSALLTDLGLTVRDTVSSPIAAPSTKPILSLAILASLAHNLRFADETTPTSRARPFGVVGLQVFYAYETGADTSSSEAMHFEGVASKINYPITYPAAAAGKTATVRARWFNRRGEVGPLSDPVTLTVAA